MTHPMMRHLPSPRRSEPPHCRISRVKLKDGNHWWIVPCDWGIALRHDARASMSMGALRIEEDGVVAVTA